MTEYVRDGRAPIPIKEVTSIVMRANKARNTSPEINLRKALCKHGMTGYRLNYKNMPGRPDIAFVSRKIAIFVHGCFWHRCPICGLPLPKSNQAFWKSKFEKNVYRDKLKAKKLKEEGWKVLVIWECSIKKNINKQVNKIRRVLYE